MRLRLSCIVLFLICAAPLIVSGTVTFRYQTDLDEYLKDKVFGPITDDVRIRGNGDLTVDNITTLLTKIEAVHGELLFESFTAYLTDLRCFQNFTYTRSLRFTDPRVLKTVEGFEGTVVNESLSFYNAYELESVAGLDVGVRTLTEFILDDCWVLRSLNGTAFESVSDRVFLNDLHQLTDMTAFLGVTGNGHYELNDADDLVHFSLGAYTPYAVEIVFCDLLYSAEPIILTNRPSEPSYVVLDSLTTLRGDIEIVGGDVEFLYLETVRYIDTCYISNTTIADGGMFYVNDMRDVVVEFESVHLAGPSLAGFYFYWTDTVDIQGLSGNVSHVTGGLWFQSNNFMLDLDWMQQVFAPVVTLGPVPLDPTSPSLNVVESHNDGATVYFLLLRIYNMEDLVTLDGYPRLEGECEGDLEIRDNNLLQTNSPDRWGLTSLKPGFTTDDTRYGDLTFQDNRDMLDASFPELQSLRNLYLYSNNDLVNFTLPALVEITGTLTIEDNAKLRCEHMETLLRATVWGAIVSDYSCTGTFTLPCLPAQVAASVDDLKRPSPHVCNVTISPTTTLHEDLTAAIETGTAPWEPMTVCLEPGYYSGVKAGVSLRACGGGAVWVKGAGQNATFVDGKFEGRFLRVEEYALGIVSDLTYMDGSTPGLSWGGFVFGAPNSALEVRNVTVLGGDSGAVYATYSTLVISHSTFANCSFTPDVGGTNVGSAVYLYSGEMTIDSSSFVGVRNNGGRGAVSTLYATVTVVNTMVTGCYNSGGMAGMYLQYGPTTVVKDSMFIGNTGSFTALRIEYGATVVVSDCNFINSSAVSYTNGVYAAPLYMRTTSATVFGCSFSGAYGYAGTGIHLFYMYDVLVSNSTFTDNTCTANGALYVNNGYAGGRCIVSNLTFVRNEGGPAAIYAINTLTKLPVSVLNCAFEDNVAASRLNTFYAVVATVSGCSFKGTGGGYATVAYIDGANADDNSFLFTRNNSVSLLTESTFTQGAAFRGQRKAHVTVVGGSFEGLDCTNAGCFLQSTTSYWTFNSTHFRNIKTATNQAGGVFHLTGTLTLNDCSFNKTSANDGGAIFTSGLFMRNTHIYDSSSQDDGGAISMTFGRLVNSTIRGTTANDDGGAVDILEVTGGYVEFVDMVITDTTCGDEGGAVASSTDLYLLRTHIANTTAPSFGGAVAMQATTVDVELTVVDSVLEDASSGSTGGAINSAGGAVELRGSIIRRSSSIGGGGGIAGAGDVTLSDSEVTDCTTLGSGGGGCVSAGRLATSSVVLANCVAGDGGDGGCAAAYSAAIVNTSFSYCNADGDGGGLAIEQKADEEAVDVASTTFEWCSANGNGGGVALTATDPLHSLVAVLREVDIVNCSAGFGGAVYSETVGVWLESSRVTDTDANVGGGLFVDGAAMVVDTRLASCSAYSIGGALFAFFGAQLAVEDSVVEDAEPDGLFSLLSLSVSLRGSVVDVPTGASGISVKGSFEVVINGSVVSAPAESSCVVLDSVVDTYVIDSFLSAENSLAVAKPAFECISGDVYVARSVLCTAFASPLLCSSGCKVRGDMTCSSEVADVECMDRCEAADFCVPDTGKSTAPNMGCPACSGRCWLSTDGCAANSTDCVDAPGDSFTCPCATGFENSTGTDCADIDECALGIDSCTGLASCVNTFGSYVCVCPSGYQKQGSSSCSDVDECGVSGICGNGDCVNTVGSYWCDCHGDNYIYNNVTVCRPCEAGYYTFFGSCVGCPANTYTNSSNSVVCVACPESSTSPGLSSSCECDAGFSWGYPAEGSSLVCLKDCGLGTYLVGTTVCLPCPLNNYAASVGTCTPCPADMETNSTGATRCACVDGFTQNNGAEWKDGCYRVCGPGEYLDSEEDVCLPCPIGTFKNETSTSPNCTACPAVGAVTAATGTVDVDDCVCLPGYAAESQAGNLRCAAVCGYGLRRPSFESECESCGPGTYSDTVNEMICRQCPVNTNSPPVATNRTDCTCIKGFFSRSGRAGEGCYPCPAGAVCPGGTKPPRARKGYVSVGPESFAACSPPDACEGNDKCAKYYTGDRCAECTQDAHRVSGYCRPCGSATAVSIVLGLLLIFGGCGVLVASNLRSQTLTHATSFVIGINALQIVAQFGRLNIAWPPLAQRFFDFVAIISLNVEFFAPECVSAATNPFFLRFFLMMSLPVFVGLVLATYYGGFKAVEAAVGLTRVTEEEFVRAIFQSVSQMVLILYLPLSVAVFEYFDCVPVGEDTGIRVVATSPEVDCSSAQWKRGLLGAIPFLLAYPLVFPVSFTYALWKFHAELDETSFALRFGWLTNRYRASMYLYEIVILFRKLGVAICLTFVAASPYFQAGATFMWLVAGFAFHVKVKPYATREHNFFESACSCVVEFIVLAGVMFQDASFDDVRKNTTIAFLIVALIVAVVAAAARDILTIVKEMRLALTDDVDVDVFKSATQREAASDVALFGPALDGFLEKARSGKLSWKALVECDVELAELEVSAAVAKKRRLAAAASNGGDSGDGVGGGGDGYGTYATGYDSVVDASSEDEGSASGSGSSGEGGGDAAVSASVIDRNNMVWNHPHVGGVSISLCVDNAGEFFLKCEQKLTGKVLFVLYVMEPGRYIVSGLRTHEIHLAKNTQIALTFVNIATAQAFVSRVSRSLPPTALPVAGSILYKARQGGVEGMNTVGDMAGVLREYVAAFELELFYLKTAMVGAIGWALSAPPPPRVLNPNPPLDDPTARDGVGGSGSGGGHTHALGAVEAIAEFRLRNATRAAAAAAGGGTGVDSLAVGFNSAAFDTVVFGGGGGGGGGGSIAGGTSPARSGSFVSMVAARQRSGSTAGSLARGSSTAGSPARSAAAAAAAARVRAARSGSKSSAATSEGATVDSGGDSGSVTVLGGGGAGYSGSTYTAAAGGTGGELRGRDGSSSTATGVARGGSAAAWARRGGSSSTAGGTAVADERDSLGSSLMSTIAEGGVGGRGGGGGVGGGVGSGLTAGDGAVNGAAFSGDGEASEVGVGGDGARQLGAIRLAVLSRANVTYVKDLGVGGFGSTKLYSVADGDRVAVRVYTHRAEVESFVDEATLLAVVDHPNIIEFVGVCPEIVGLATRYMDRGSLEAALGSGSGGGGGVGGGSSGDGLSYSERLRVLFYAARGLEYLHSACSVAHRDFHPGAVFLDSDGGVRVGKLSRAGAAGAPKYGGRGEYASPEQRSGEAGTLACDVYAFGITARRVLEASAAGSGGGGDSGGGVRRPVISGLPVGDSGDTGTGGTDDSVAISNTTVDSNGSFAVTATTGGSESLVGSLASTGSEAPVIPPRRATTKDSLLVQAARRGAAARGEGPPARPPRPSRSGSESGARTSGGSDPDAPPKPPRRPSAGSKSGAAAVASASVKADLRDSVAESEARARASTVEWRRYDPEGHLRVRTARALLDAVDRGLCATLAADRPTIGYVVALMARCLSEADESNEDAVRVAEAYAELMATSEEGTGFGVEYGRATAARSKAARVVRNSISLATTRGGRGDKGKGDGAEEPPPEALETMYGVGVGATQRVAVNYLAGTPPVDNPAFSPNQAALGTVVGGDSVMFSMDDDEGSVMVDPSLETRMWS